MSFFDRLFGKKNSAESAKERLQLVLIHDRTDLTPAELDSLKDDLIDTISRHVEIDVQAVQIGIVHDGRGRRALQISQRRQIVGRCVAVQLQAAHDQGINRLRHGGFAAFGLQGHQIISGFVNAYRTLHKR